MAVTSVRVRVGELSTGLARKYCAAPVERLAPRMSEKRYMITSFVFYSSLCFL